ncbi:RDD family protein [Streptomyces sp. NPDC051080]|uniref:RDD family protein n=1 Tax=Streptomyces sp. NPDC051080 TaxID=3157222 RepID=UPI003415DFF8
MSAPTPAPGDESPREGYYPDPSIPGYVRYWNGTSWVPGTSRPAPEQGGPTSAAPSGEAPSAPVPEPQSQPRPQPSVPAPAPVDETGPVFLDEGPHAGDRPEPATAWQADASRQTGFGGEHDRRVSWGGTGQPGEPDGQDGEPGRPDGQSDPRTPAGRAPADPVPGDRVPAVRAPADGAPAPDPRQPAATPTPAPSPLPSSPAPENTVAIRIGRQGRPGGGTDAGTGDAGRPPTDGTVTIRAVGRGGGPPARRTSEPAASEGTMAMRAIAPGPGAQPSAPAQNPVQQNPVRQNPVQGQNPAQAQSPAPWAQQGNQSAQPPAQAARPQLPAQQHQPQLQAQQPQLRPQPQQAQQLQQAQQPQQPVVPWKPPVDDPFQQLAQAQAAARPAGLGKRFAARLIDSVVLMALVGAIGFPLVSQALDHIDEKINAAKLSGETVTVWLVDSTTAGLFGAVLGAFLVLGVLLEALPTAKWGRTLGKKVCGLEVRDIESHGAPSFGAALRRWLVYGVLGILVIGVVNALWCLIDRPWRQCWHDKAAHTFVAG